MAPLRLSVLAIPFGSPSDLDKDGDYFSPRTDLGLDAGHQRWPVYWQHTQDPSVGDRRIGWANGLVRKPDGWWTDVEVDDPQVAARLETMAADGTLFASSGSVSHLVRRAGGELLKWPIAELSLTPTPSNRRAVARLAPPAHPELDGPIERMQEMTYDMQRSGGRRGNSPAVSRLQDAIATFRQNIAT